VSVAEELAAATAELAAVFERAAAALKIAARRDASVPAGDDVLAWQDGRIVRVRLAPLARHEETIETTPIASTPRAFRILAAHALADLVAEATRGEPLDREQRTRLVAQIAGRCSPVLGGVWSLELARNVAGMVADGTVDLRTAATAAIHHRRTSPHYLEEWPAVTDRQAIEMTATIAALGKTGT